MCVWSMKYIQYEKLKNSAQGLASTYASLTPDCLIQHAFLALGSSYLSKSGIILQHAEVQIKLNFDMN